MPLSGMHIVCASVAASPGGGPLTEGVPGAVLPIAANFGKTMASAAVAGQVPGSGSGVTYLIRAHTSIQGFVAFSKVSGADALSAASDANRPRWLIEPGADNDFFASAGDYVAWAPA